MAVRFVILGGGPAGVEAAATASRLGAEVTLVERDVVGGAANLWDCVPSKAMIATAGALALTRRSAALALRLEAEPPDLGELRSRIEGISDRLAASNVRQLESQGVRIIRGSGRLAGAHRVEVVQEDKDVEVLDADAVLLSTGSSPRVPAWAEVDGEAVMTTRDAYPPRTIPTHLVVVGSGVTGVEFVHLFRSLGSKVTLVVSRQQVLPMKDAEVAAALEADFLDSGVVLVKGARAMQVDRVGDDQVMVACEDGRKLAGSHVLLAIGSVPGSSGLGLASAGVEVNEGGYVPVNQHCQSNVPHLYAAGDLSGRLQLASVAAAQGRKVAEHVMGLHTREHRHLDYDKAASAIFTEPEIADVGLAEAEAFALGRKIRVTKVPFALSAKAMIDGEARGFVKLISDPATGIVLGGTIVGARAAELISVIAMAVSSRLRVDDIAETVFVHPALAEVISAAAE